MKQQILIYGLICIEARWQKLDNVNIIITGADVVFFNFETEQERQEYIDINNIILYSDI